MHGPVFFSLHWIRSCIYEVVMDEGSAADSNPRVDDEKELPSLPLTNQDFSSLPWIERELLFVPMRAASADYLKSVCSFILLKKIFLSLCMR